MGLFHCVLVYMGDLQSCTEFATLDTGILISKIDDVLTEHGGLLNVLPLAVHLIFWLGLFGP